MIISASHKTDSPAFYGAWFHKRLAAGYCKMVNPYGGQVYRVGLRRDEVDGFVFWTKNLGPFLDTLATVHARGCPFVVQYTITGYPRALEFSVVEAARATAHMQRLIVSLCGRMRPTSNGRMEVLKCRASHAISLNGTVGTSLGRETTGGSSL